jgi:D-aminoacyl-tRNA deacylase
VVFASIAHSHALAVSQFTLLASTKKGSKPDFHGALGGDQAKAVYEIFFSKVQEGYKSDLVKDGVFQAMMVSICWEGFITSLTIFLGSCPG